jgi:DNA-binding NarL/FixJ family response regulator
MRNLIRIVIVDDNAALLEELVKNQPDDRHRIIAFFSNSIDLLANINYYDPDMLLVDLELPGTNGYDTVKKLNYYGGELKLVAIASAFSELCLENLKKSGFMGVIHRNDQVEKIWNILDRVMENNIAF